MSQLVIHRTAKLQGRTTVPSDKSLSHRALILGALAAGTNRVRNWLAAGDTLATLGAVRTLGIDVERDGDSLTFTGGAFRAPDKPIDCVNAGTAMRLMAGVMAGQPFESVLDGSEQLRKRPMRRVTDPLRAMGADISDTDGKAPMTFRPATLKGTIHQLTVASAQVKSCLLLAGLFADGQTTVIEPGPSRDHTERMLSAMGAKIDVQDKRVSVEAQDNVPLLPFDLTVPGDISSAAFLLAAGACLPGSEITIEGVGINPTRTGIIDVLRAMGADISILDEHEEGGEPVATLVVRGGALTGTTVSGDLIVRAIDELPIIAIAATQAEGETVIKDAAELRVKEVDRISVLSGEMRKLGAEVEERPDGMIIHGAPLKGGAVHSHGDHRMGMALAVAGLFADGDTVVEDSDCMADSFPGFPETLISLGADIA